MKPMVSRRRMASGLRSGDSTASAPSRAASGPFGPRCCRRGGMSSTLLGGGGAVPGWPLSLLRLASAAALTSVSGVCSLLLSALLLPLLLLGALPLPLLLAATRRHRRGAARNVGQLLRGQAWWNDPGMHFSWAEGRVRC